MKKLFLVTVLSLGSLSMFAHEADKGLVEKIVVTQDTYVEVSLDELPETIATVLATDYPSAKLEKAYVNEAKQYKLELSLSDGTVGTLYADEKGNWIK